MLLLRGSVVVTMDARRRLIHDGAVLVDGDRIAAVGSTAELGGTPGITRVVGDRHLVLPGLVNAHTHCFQTLYRGLGQRLPLAEWSRRAIFPLSRCLTPADAAAAAALACLEMATGGTTTFVDSHYVHVDPATFDGVADAVVASGLRAVLGRAAVDGAVVPEPFRETPAVARRRTESAIERWHGRGHGRVRVRPEALSERTATREMIGVMADVGRRTKTGFNMHLAESEPAARHVRETEGCSGVGLLERLDALGPDVLLAHGVWLDERDLDILARTRTGFSHNPVSNQYLGVGVAPVVDARARRVRVGLGSDGPASNDNLDMFGTMKACALLHRTAGGDAALSAEDVVALATIEGARAVGLGDEVGSLEIGKKADVVMLALDRPEMVPLHRPYETLVYAALAAAVDTVVVDGTVIVDGGLPVSMDRRAILTEARGAAAALADRAGIA